MNGLQFAIGILSFLALCFWLGNKADRHTYITINREIRVYRLPAVDREWRENMRRIR